MRQIIVRTQRGSAMAGRNLHANCIDCPYHLVINDRDPHDWLNDDDEAIVCMITMNPNQDIRSIYPAERSGFRIVASSIRPHNLYKEGSSPDWCPMPAPKESESGHPK